MKKRFKNLNTKLVIHFIIFSMIILSVIWFMQAFMLNTTYKIIRKTEIEKLFHKIQRVDDMEEINKLAFKNDSKVFILDNNLDVISSTDDVFGNLPRSFLIDINNTIKELNKVDTINKDIKTNRFNTEINIFASKTDAGYIVILSTIDPIQSTVYVLKIQLIYITILCLIIAIIISFVISKKLSHPISIINEKAKELENGNFNVEFKQGYYTEIDELSKTLNNTAIKLRDVDKLRKEVISNVSHDLKTPLAMIKAYSEMLQDISGEEKQKRDEHLEIISKEVDNLNLLISDMLDLSKLESLDYKLNLTEFNIFNVITEIKNRFKHIIDSGIKIEINSYSENINVKLDKIKISQVIYNLIGNAINFVGEDKTVYVNLINIDNEVKIEVTDSGKGINEKDLPHIFERYYTTNDKYKKVGVSTGLGLSIVKNILEKHKLEYGVYSKENIGTTFWFVCEVKNI